MNKHEIKKVFLRALIIGGLTFGAINVKPMVVEATQMEVLSPDSLSYNQYRIIRKYSEILNIDMNFAMEALSEVVDNPKDLSTIDGVTYDSEELAILTFMYRLAFKPDKVGYSKDDIVKVDSGYEMKLSHEEMLYYYCDLLDIDHEMALSISYAECGGMMDSHNYLVNNNPAGIGPYMKFCNKEAGLIYYVFLLRDGYKLGKEVDDNFVNNTASIYCPDDPGHWVSLVNSYYPNVHNDYFHYNMEVKVEYEESNHVDKNNDYEIIEKLNEHYGTGYPSQKIKTITKIKSAKH